MSKIIVLISTLLSLSAIAGTHGGGMESVQPFSDGGSVLSNSEIVYHLGEQNGLVKFAYGQLADGQWNVKNISIQKDLLKAQELSAIQLSKERKTWVGLQ